MRVIIISLSHGPSSSIDYFPYLLKYMAYYVIDPISLNLNPQSVEHANYWVWMTQSHLIVAYSKFHPGADWTAVDVDEKGAGGRKTGRGNYKWLSVVSGGRYWKTGYPSTLPFLSNNSFLLYQPPSSIHLPCVPSLSRVFPFLILVLWQTFKKGGRWAMSWTELRKLWDQDLSMDIIPNTKCHLFLTTCRIFGIASCQFKHIGSISSCFEIKLNYSLKIWILTRM